MLSTQRAVLKVVPFSALEAQVAIPSNTIGFVRVGQKVDLSIDSFPATDFYVPNGSVKHIGSDVLPPDPSKGINEYRFPTDISISSQQLKLKNGQTLPLQVGTSLTANIKLRKVVIRSFAWQLQRQNLFIEPDLTIAQPKVLKQ